MMTTNTFFRQASGGFLSLTRENGICCFCIFLLLQLLFLLWPDHLQASVPNDPDPVSIPWPRVEKILADRPFTSGDELFQLLFILYKREGMTSFRLEQNSLSHLKKKISTLFPLEGCESIELQAGQVTFRFSKEQQVTIPHTWLQASLQITDKLVLAIEDNPPVAELAAASIEEVDPETQTICFTVREGSLQVHFSVLLKVLGGTLRDAEGSALTYQINEAKKISRLQLTEKTTLTGESLKMKQATAIETDRGMQWVDILHADFPGTEDIGIVDNRLAFLGTDVELLPDHMIRIGTAEPQKNDKAWTWFSGNIKAFREYVTTGQLATAIDYTRDFAYHFEERKITMIMGFHGSSDEKPPMMPTAAP